METKMDLWEVIDPKLRFRINGGITEKFRSERVSIPVRSGSSTKDKARYTSTEGNKHTTCPTIVLLSWIIERPRLELPDAPLSLRCYLTSPSGVAPGGTPSTLISHEQGRDSHGRCGNTAQWIVAKVQIKIQCAVDASKSRNVKTGGWWP